MTAVQPVHLSRIGTIEAIEQAKGELVEALPDDGVAILNADDERVRRMAARTSARVMTYGFAPDADVRAEEVVSRGADGMAFDLVAPGRPPARRDPDPRPAGRPQRAGRRGRRARRPGCRLDGDRRRARAAAGARRIAAQLVRAGGVTIVDDSYNASPGSVAAALELLGRAAGPADRRPRRDARARRRARGRPSPGRRGRGRGVVDRLVVVGDGRRRDRRRARSRAGLAAGRGHRRSRTARRPVDVLRRDLAPGDVVLVKASRGIALDLLVDELVAALGGPETPAR